MNKQVKIPIWIVVKSSHLGYISYLQTLRWKEYPADDEIFQFLGEKTIIMIIMIKNEKGREKINKKSYVKNH